MGQQVTTAALVIGCIPYGDKSQILKLWTRSLGLQAYMLYSSRGKKCSHQALNVDAHDGLAVRGHFPKQGAAGAG